MKKSNVNSSFDFRQILMQGDLSSGKPSCFNFFQSFWDLPCLDSVFPQSMVFSFSELNFELRYKPLYRFHQHAFFLFKILCTVCLVCLFRP